MGQLSHYQKLTQAEKQTTMATLCLSRSQIKNVKNFFLTWNAFWNSRPGSIFADRGGVVGLLELREAADVDSVRVGHARP